MSKIYVGQLSDQTTEETLRHVFEEYGIVTHVELRTGFAFVSFEAEGGAERAIEVMNDKELDGSRIRVEKERGTTEGGFRGTDGRIKPPKRLDLRILIRGLHPKVDWKDLKDWARGIVGEVTYSNVFDREGQHMGLIELKDEASLERALASLGDVPLLGAQVTVERDAIDSEYSRIPPAGIVPSGHFRSHPQNQNHNQSFRGGRDHERGSYQRDRYYPRDYRGDNINSRFPPSQPPGAYPARDLHRDHSDRDYPPYAAGPPLRAHSRDRDSHFHPRDVAVRDRRDSRDRRDRGEASSWQSQYRARMPSPHYVTPLPSSLPYQRTYSRDRDDDPRSFRGSNSGHGDVDHRRMVGNDRAPAFFQRGNSRERGGDFRFQGQPQQSQSGNSAAGDGFGYDGPAGKRFREETGGGRFAGGSRRRSHSRSRSRDRFSPSNNNSNNTNNSNFNVFSR